MFNNSQSQIFQYNGSSISFQKGDSVMVNATEMARPFGKTTKDWLRTKQAKEFISSLSAVRQISPTKLVEVKQGGGQEQGTWMHEDVAMEFARWLSPSFAIWCNDRIKELLTIGMTATQPTLEQMINNPDLIISLATQLKQEREEKNKLQEETFRQQRAIEQKEECVKQLEAESEQQRITIELQDSEIRKSAPKVDYYDRHLQSVNTQTSTQVAKQIGMDAPKLHRKLKEIGFIYKQSDQWMLHSPYSTWGLHSTRTQTFTRSDGSIGSSTYTVWKAKGVRFIIALYENGWNVKKAISSIKAEHAA